MSFMRSVVLTRQEAEEKHLELRLEQARRLARSEVPRLDDDGLEAQLAELNEALYEREGRVDYLIE